MTDDVHFIGVANAKRDGELTLLRLAASDGKAYSLRLTDAAIQGIVQSLQGLVPLQRNAERNTLQVSRSQSLVTADGRKAILLETQLGPIAFELPDEAVTILQRQLADLQTIQPPQSSH